MTLIEISTFSLGNCASCFLSLRKYWILTIILSGWAAQTNKKRFFLFAYLIRWEELCPPPPPFLSPWDTSYMLLLAPRLFTASGWAPEEQPKWSHRNTAWDAARLDPLLRTAEDVTCFDCVWRRLLVTDPGVFPCQTDSIKLTSDVYNSAKMGKKNLPARWRLPALVMWLILLCAQVK